MKIRASGFTLVEAMISAALVGLISIGILTVIMSFANNSARFTAREDLNNLGKVVQLILSDDALCVQAIRNAGGNPVDFIPDANGEVAVDSIVNPNPTTPAPVVTSNTNYSPHLFIRQLKLVRDTSVPPVTESIALQPKGGGAYVTTEYTSYRATLQIQARSTSADLAAAVNPNIPRDNIAPLMIPLKVYVATGSNAIARCMLASAANQTCIGLGGTYDTTIGRCVFPVCDLARQNADIARWQAQVPPITDDFRCQGIGNANCTPPVYFWGFQVTGSVTTPVCICSDSCSPPPATGGGY